MTNFLVVSFFFFLYSENIILHYNQSMNISIQFGGQCVCAASGGSSSMRKRFVLIFTLSQLPCATFFYNLGKDIILSLSQFSTFMSKRLNHIGTYFCIECSTRHDCVSFYWQPDSIWKRRDIKLITLPLQLSKSYKYN